MLLTGLQGESVRRPSIGIDGDTDEAPRKMPLKAFGDADKPSVRTAVEHRDAEALRRTDDHIGPQSAGRLEQGQGEQVGGDHDPSIALMGLIDDRARISDRTRCSGILQQDATNRPVGQPVSKIGDHHIDIHGCCSGADYLDRLREGISIDDERTDGAASRPTYQRHGFSHRGSLVEQGSVRRG